MNILIVSCVFPPEPVVSATIVNDIAIRLVENGNSVIVVCPPPSRPLGFDFSNVKLQLQPFTRIVLDSYTNPNSNIWGRFKENCSFGKKVAHYITKNHKLIDVIYVNSWPLFSQYIIVKTAKKYGIRVVMHIQDIYPEVLMNKLPAIIRFVVNRILKNKDIYLQQNSDKVITIGSVLANYLQVSRSLRKEQITHVYNWQDVSMFVKYLNERQEIEPHPLTFMFLGNIGTIPMLHLVIDAFAKAKIKNSRLIIAGSGTTKKALMMQATQYPNCDIQFIEAQKEQVPAIQAKADVLLLTLQKNVACYALPSKLVAYMMSSKPIIVTSELGTDLAEIITANSCGWIVDPESVEQMILAMKQVAQTSSEKLKQMGQAGYDFAYHKFSSTYNLEKITNIITNK